MMTRFKPLIFLSIFFAALTIPLFYDPLHLAVTDDFGIFLYSAGAMAQGFVPPRVAFDINSASILYPLAAVPMRIAELTGNSGVLGFRAAALAVTALCVGLTALLAVRLSNSMEIAVTSGGLMLLATTLLQRTAQGLEPKTTMVLFALIALLGVQRRGWFLAGLTAMAAGLAWRPGWMLLGIVFLLALFQPEEWQVRVRAIARAGIGAVAIVIPYLALYASQNALYEMWTQSMIAPLALGRGTSLTPLNHLVSTFVQGYPGLVVPAVAALLGLGYLFAKYFRTASSLMQVARMNLAATGLAVQQHETAGLRRELVPVATPAERLRSPSCPIFSARETVRIPQSHHAVALVLYTAAYLIFVGLDFQSEADWIPLVPAVAVLGAWSLWGGIAVIQRRVVLPGSAVRFRLIGAFLLAVYWGVMFGRELPTAAIRSETWQRQQIIARNLSRWIGPEASVLVIGAPEILYFMQRFNEGNITHLHGNYPLAINQLEPGGMAEYWKRVQASEPQLVVVARVDPNLLRRGRLRTLGAWLARDYVPLKSCLPGYFYVRATRADTLFPVGARVADCFERD